MSVIRATREEADSRYVNRPGRCISIERSIIQDSSLSSNARFLYCLMRSHDGWTGRDGKPWRFNDRDLMNKLGWSRRETLYRYRTELVEAGLVVKLQLANDQGQFQGVLWEVLADYPEPSVGTPADCSDRSPEKPDSAKTVLRQTRSPEKPESGKSGLRHQIRNNPYQGYINTPLSPHGGETVLGESDPDPSLEPDGPDQHDDGLSETGSASPKQESAQSGLEGSARPVSTASGSTTYPEAFEAVWKAYRKGSGSKRQAYRAWTKAMQAYPDLDLLGVVQRFVVQREREDARCCERGETLQDRKRFWKDLSTWLNQCCWEDVPEEPVQEVSSGSAAPAMGGLPHLKMANFDPADYAAYLAYCARDDEERERRRQAGGEA